MVDKFMNEEYTGERAIDLLNNKQVKNNILKYNHTMKMPSDYNFGEVGLINDKVFFLMNQLGIPIGTELFVDSKGNDVYEWSDVPDDEIKHFFVPINNIEEYETFYLEHGYIHMTVNPNYMSESQVRNVAYLLKYANSNRVFDFYTMNELQTELLEAAPLDYNRSMKIFRKYYTNDICQKFIENLKVNKERFYYLSGLNDVQNNIDNFDKLNKKKNIAYER